MKVPMVIRAIIGRGWGQALPAQQDDAFLVRPYPRAEGGHALDHRADAKGMLIRRSATTIQCSSRAPLALRQSASCPTATTPSRSASRTSCARVRPTVIATSWMNVEASRRRTSWRGATCTSRSSIRAPWRRSRRDAGRSVRKTGRCIVADNDWSQLRFRRRGRRAHLEECLGELKSPMERIGFADVPCPTRGPGERVLSQRGAHHPRRREKARPVAGRPGGREFLQPREPV